MIYWILCKGEVCVNKGRIKFEYKLVDGDVVWIFLVRVFEGVFVFLLKLDKIVFFESYILFEDDCILVMNKFFGIVVYGGSGLSFGLIEGLRVLCFDVKFMEFVYCLDREILGCILIVKKWLVLWYMYE